MFSIPKKNNSNKTTKLKCVETGNRLVYASTEKNVNMPTEKTNSNKNKTSLCTTKPETVNSSTKKVLVPTEPDVCLFMSTKIKWTKSDSLTKLGSLKNWTTGSQKTENIPDSPLPKKIKKQSKSNRKNKELKKNNNNKMSKFLRVMKNF